MTSTNAEPAPIALPEGLWSQPQVDFSAVPELGETEAVQLITTPAKIVYDYTPGRATTRFLRAIAEKRLVGQRCPTTGKVYVPPRGVSPISGLPTTEEVELGHDGTVISFCVVNLDFTGNAQEIPYVSALILVDGSDIPIYGLVREIPYSDVRPGLRLKSVWVDDADLTTSFENIKWWAPNGEPDLSESELAEYV
ncbi:MAG: Zn-ribbon domain-containing OB-fold protein [Microthrixaceae bacterium]